MVLLEETYKSLLANWPVARLATVSPETQPHCVPVVFCEYDGAIYSPLDGKRKKTTNLRRFANLAVNPKATLLLDEYTADWQHLWWVRIDGVADRFEPAPAEAQLIAQRLQQKYPQYQDPALMFDISVYLRLRPAGLSWWSQSGSVVSINR